MNWKEHREKDFKIIQVAHATTMGFIHKPNNIDYFWIIHYCIF